MLRRGSVGLLLVLAIAGCRVRVPDATECDPTHADRPLCGLQNPEDIVALPGTPWFLASQLRRRGNPPGSLVAFTADGDEAVTVVGPDAPAERLVDPFLERAAAMCPDELPPDGLEPHGLELVVEGEPPWTLLVVNHGAREAIEVYEVTPTDDVPQLRWISCIPVPDGFAANDVAALDDGEFVASLVRARGIGFTLTLVRMALGLSVGDVAAWSPDGEWSHLPRTHAQMPNGVAVRGDDQLFVADWGGSRLIRVDRTAGRREVVLLPHHPDNLSWAADGRLVVAGQIGSTRIAYGCFDGAVRNCGQPWSIVTVDPDTLAVTMVAEGDGQTFGAASSAVWIDDTLTIGTWAGDRVIRRRIP